MTAQELLQQAHLDDDYSYNPEGYMTRIALDPANNIDISAPTQEEAEAIRALVYEAIENQNNTFTL